jgi:hypothetical protein
VKVTEAPTPDNPICVVEVDLGKKDVGDLAKAVAGCKTPHKKKEAPSATLILDAPGLNAERAKGLADALKGVKGVVAAQSSADVGGKRLEIRLDDAGGAKLADIQKALADYLKK